MIDALIEGQGHMIDKNEMKSRKSFMQRLLSDTAGNTIAMMGAALLPLTAMVGGGVDASRTYMVKARLQQACDAGVLAGRKAVGDGVFDQQANDRAIALFNANFPKDYQNSKNTSFVASSPNSGGLVEGIATTELPTVVMKVFGYKKITLQAECNALLTISNADVMMVLDTTGSMSWNVSNGNGGTTTRINALRNAMTDFYDILATASASSQARIRYGMVPYSGTVNVGRLLLANSSGNNMLMGQSAGDTASYQTRRAVYEVDGGTVTTTTTETFAEDDTDPALLTSSNCNKFANNENFRYYRVDRYNGNITTPDRSSTSSHTQNYNAGSNPKTNGNITTSYSLESWSGSQASRDGNTIRQCTRRVTTTQPGKTETFDGSLSGATFKRWEYRNLSWPVRDYVSSIDGGTSVRVPSNTFSDSTRVRWGGCIEERETVSDDTFSYSGILSRIVSTDAKDLDIDSAPSDNATRWRPYWPEVSYARRNSSGNWTTDDVTSNGSSVQTACPQPARLLGEMTKSAFTTYANALSPTGGTYHDIGAIWGARLSSPDGIFASNVNQAAPNNGFVSRHVIFMTDGILDPGPIYYSAYGVDYHDRRVSDNGSDSQLVARHTSRFKAVCAAIRAKGIRLWVVAFATDLSDDLKACASPNSAFVSTNAAQLNQNFAEIAASIADLRLTE